VASVGMKTYFIICSEGWSHYKSAI